MREEDKRKIWEILQKTPKIDEIQPIPIPELLVGRAEKLVELLLVSLHRYREILTSPFVYEASSLAKKGWDWKRFGEVPFSLPLITDILSRERVRDREKKGRKRTVRKLASLLLSPPKLVRKMRFQVYRSKSGVYYTMTTLCTFGTILSSLLDSYGEILLRMVLSGSSPVYELPIPKQIVPYDELEDEPFCEGVALFFSYPPFALLLVQLPKDFPSEEDLKWVSEERRERLIEFRVKGTKFWLLLVDEGRERGEDEGEVLERLKGLLRYLKRRVKRRVKEQEG